MSILFWIAVFIWGYMFFWIIWLLLTWDADQAHIVPNWIIILWLIGLFLTVVYILGKALI